jgi:Flp pilus assembly protein TadB
VVLIVFAVLGMLIFPHKEDYAFLVATIPTAIFSWFAGKAWNTTKNDRIVTDDKTGQKFILKGGGHKLFWIQMQYWGIILPIWSILLLFRTSVWLAVGLSVIFCAIILVYRMKSAAKIKNEPANSSLSESEAKKEL